MNFRTHLWREWRERRRALVFLAAALAALVALLSQLVPEPWIGDPITVHGGALVALVAAVLCVGADLFASERQRGTLRFLDRLPRGRSTAFRAKLTFYTLLAVGSSLYGALLALGTTAVLSGALPAGMLTAVTSWTVALVVLALAWVFTVSTWVSTGAFALPTTAFFLALAAFPVGLMVTEGRRYGVAEWGYVALAGLALLGALCAARLGFGGGSRRRTALLSILVGAASFSPAWAWVGHRYVQFHQREPRIGDILLGADHRYAFVNLYRSPVDPDSDAGRLPFEALLLDLSTETPSFVSANSDTFWATNQEFAGVRTVLRASGFPVLDLVRWDAARVTFDGTTGERSELGVGALRELALQGLGLPDEIEPGARLFVSRCGTGFQARVVAPGSEGRFGDWVWWDVNTGRSLRKSDLKERDLEIGIGLTLVRPGRWLSRDLHEKTWLWFDPERLDLEPAPHLHAGDEICQVFEDGSLLLTRDRALLRVTPETGETVELRVDGDGVDPEWFHEVSAQRAEPLPIDRRALVHYAGRAKHRRRAERRLAILDPVANRLEVLAADLPTPQVISHERGLALAVEGGDSPASKRRRLVSIDTESGERHVLLDLDDPPEWLAR